jgi:predicted RNase H-like nuclease (RuvC/YqgF family)
MNDINILNIPAYQRLKSVKQKRKSDELLVRKTRKKPRITRHRRPEIPELPLTNQLKTKSVFEAPIKHQLEHPKQFSEFKIAGTCEGYFEKINVTILKLSAPLKKGDIILIEKNGGIFMQDITSMQIDKQEVYLAPTGSSIGIKTWAKPKIGGTFYKISAQA